MLGAPIDPGMAWGASKSAVRTGRWAAGWTFIHPYAAGLLLLAVSYLAQGPAALGAFAGESFSEARGIECTKVGPGVASWSCIDKAGGSGPSTGTRSYDNTRLKASLLRLAGWAEFGGIALLSAASLVTFLSLFDEPAYQLTERGAVPTRGHVSLGARKRGIYAGSRRVWQRAQTDQRQAVRRVKQAAAVVEGFKRWKLRHHPAPPEVAGQSRKTQREARKRMRAEAQSEAHRIATAMRVDAGGPADQVAAWRHVVATAHEPVELPKAPPKMAAAFPSNPGPPPPLPTDEAVS